MRFVVTIVATLMILGLAAFGLVSAQKGVTPTSTAASLCASLRRHRTYPLSPPVRRSVKLPKRRVPKRR